MGDAFVAPRSFISKTSPPRHAKTHPESESCAPRESHSQSSPAPIATAANTLDSQLPQNPPSIPQSTQPSVVPMHSPHPAGPGYKSPPIRNRLPLQESLSTPTREFVTAETAAAFALPEHVAGGTHRDTRRASAKAGASPAVRAQREARSRPCILQKRREPAPHIPDRHAISVRTPSHWSRSLLHW